MNVRLYELDNSIQMCVIDDEVIKLGNLDIAVLTRGQKRILNYLATNFNNCCSHKQIYEQYNPEGTAADIESAVIKQVSAIHTALKKHDIIASVHGVGYKISGKAVKQHHGGHSEPVINTNLENTNWDIKQVQGEYVGFYLSPKGDGSVHGIRIKIDGSEKVVAIHSIHSADTLCHRNTSYILQCPEDSDALKTWQKTFKNSTRGSRIFTGNITGAENLIEFKMSPKNSSYQMTIILDLRRYLLYTKFAPEAKYRGGLGLKIVINDEFSGTYVGHIGLIRQEYVKGISMDDPELKQHLCAADTTDYIKLQDDKDRLWFEWFYKKYEKNS